MDPDTEAAALAHQQELEVREYNEMLANDPSYVLWLDQLNKQEYDNAQSE